jgi:hypothetical protein
VIGDDLEVFEQLQPWYWEEEARKVGVDVDPATERHPLVKLTRLAIVDRHRVPHPVVARAGDTWLGHEEGVEVEVRLFKGYPGGAKPGEVVVEWRVDPPGAAASVDPVGDVILALSEEGARYRQSALDELREMQRSVALATRRVGSRSSGSSPRTSLPI